jgi:hypothetical protein
MPAKRPARLTIEHAPDLADDENLCDPLRRYMTIKRETVCMKAILKAPVRRLAKASQIKIRLSTRAPGKKSLTKVSTSKSAGSKTASRRKASNGRKSMRIVMSPVLIKHSGPNTGAQAIVMKSGGHTAAVVTRVQGLGRRVIAQLVAGHGQVRQFCFAKAGDGSYRLAGNRNPQSTRLYVP